MPYNNISLILFYIYDILLLLGNRRFDEAANKNNPGECTLHARICGGGTGIFFIIQHFSVVLLHDSRACFYPSIYLDSHGETDTSRGQNRPMYLSLKRYKKIEELYKNHLIPYEVARIRSNKDRVIRQFWY